MEVFKVGLVESVADYFDVEVVELGGREAVTEVGRWIYGLDVSLPCYESGGYAPRGVSTNTVW